MIRSVFPTKAKLLEAVAQEALQKCAPSSLRTAKSSSNDDWLDRRFRILERAITSLEDRFDNNVRNNGGRQKVVSSAVKIYGAAASAKAPPVQPKPNGPGLADEPAAPTGGTSDPQLAGPEQPTSLPSTPSLELEELSSHRLDLQPRFEADQVAPPAEAAALAPLSGMQQPTSAELPPIVDTDPQAAGEQFAGESAPPNEIALGLGLWELPRKPAVEPEVMRALLSNARAQVTKVAGDQAEMKFFEQGRPAVMDTSSRSYSSVRAYPWCCRQLSTFSADFEDRLATKSGHSGAATVYLACADH